MFVAVGNTPADQDPIDAGDFLPPIDPDDAQAVVRLGGTVTPGRLRAALIEAIADVLGQLSAWINDQVAAGYLSLQDVPAPEVDGASIHLHRYRRAVYCLAAATVAERHRSIDTTASGHQQADRLESPIDDLRRDAAWAISDIQGKRRTTVELI